MTTIPPVTHCHQCSVLRQAWYDRAERILPFEDDREARLKACRQDPECQRLKAAFVKHLQEHRKAEE